MTAQEILKQAKDEVSQKEGYTSWDSIIAEYPTNTKSSKSTEQMLEEASLLAMERIAEMSWTASKNRSHQVLDMIEEGYPDKSTYMNNLFPKI